MNNCKDNYSSNQSNQLRHIPSESLLHNMNLTNNKSSGEVN